ncbi:hypothetical protein [Deinococcus aquatilis]|uniref:hypothetical protein n=1 Tax=Deinococcus aquatilis TaxID=519440 RepID=UPI0012FCC707|nr:hypothetical protein [Deinococcus aquatilis]
MPGVKMTLELAQWLPDRVRLSSPRDSTSVEVRYSEYPFSEGWVTVGLLTDAFVPLTSSGLLFLEASLREACDERGWRWRVSGGDGLKSASASVTCGAPEQPTEWQAEAATPVEALASALLKALNPG